MLVAFAAAVLGTALPKHPPVALAQLGPAGWSKPNAAFLRQKIARNRARDAEVGRALRIWEHELPSSLGPMARPASRRKEQRLLARLRRVLGKTA